MNSCLIRLLAASSLSSLRSVWMSLSRVEESRFCTNRTQFVQCVAGSMWTPCSFGSEGVLHGSDRLHPASLSSLVPVWMNWDCDQTSAGRNSALKSLNSLKFDPYQHKHQSWFHLSINESVLVKMCSVFPHLWCRWSLNLPVSWILMDASHSRLRCFNKEKEDLSSNES